MKLANIGKHISAKITIQKWKIRGQTHWAVHRVEAGRRERTFFDSKRAAESEAMLLRSQQAAAGEVWPALLVAERQRLIQVSHEAQQLEVDLAGLLSDWKRNPRLTGTSPALENVIAELAAAKVASGRSTLHAESLSLLLRQRGDSPAALFSSRPLLGFASPSLGFPPNARPSNPSPSFMQGKSTNGRDPFTCLSGFRPCSPSSSTGLT